MPIDLQAESVFPLSEAPGRLPRLRGGKKVNISTVFRWVASGVRGVRLESVRIGGTLCTSAEALQRFCDRLSAPQGHAPAPPQTTAARRRAHERAERELDAAGV